MWAKRERRIALTINILGLILFLIIAPLVIVWALGLHFNQKTGQFDQTAVIGLTGQLSNVTVELNGQVVGNDTPLSLDNLAAGNYLLTITKTGYYPFQNFLELSAGQAVTVDQMGLVAEDPQIIPQTGTTYNPSDPFDVGMDWNNGQLTDYGALVTRLSTNILQAHRFNGGYLYQVGSDLHLFFPGDNNDYIIYRSTSSNLLQMNWSQDDWSVTVFDGSNPPQEILLNQPSD